MFRRPRSHCARIESGRHTHTHCHAVGLCVCLSFIFSLRLQRSCHVILGFSGLKMRAEYVLRSSAVSCMCVCVCVSNERQTVGIYLWPFFTSHSVSMAVICFDWCLPMCTFPSNLCECMLYGRVCLCVACIHAHACIEQRMARHASLITTAKANSSENREEEKKKHE